MKLDWDTFSEQIDAFSREPAPKIIASPGTIDQCGAHRTLEETERAQILATLKETGGVLSGPKGAAKILGIHRSTLQFRMKKLGIERRPSEYDLVDEVAE